MADDQEPRTLKQLSHRAEQLRQGLASSTPANNPSYAADLRAALAAHEGTLAAISRVSLFSPNEPLEDVATPDLPYLLTHARLADLHQKAPTSTPQERRAVLGRARASYDRFLSLLDDYDALGGPQRALFERYTDDPDAFSTVPAGSADPARRRDAKIANLKSEKALKQRLETLRRDPRYADPDANGEYAPGVDEEILRELFLAQLAFEAHMAFQGLEGINREMEMLAMAPAADRPFASDDPAAEDDTRRRQGGRGKGRDGNGDGDGDDGFTERLEQLGGLGQRGGPLLSKGGKPLQPFTLLGSRQEMARGVFKPGHNLPTMSVDEYLEEERRRGNIIEGGGEASYARPEPDEDDMDRADEETYKARAWDEYVEANPKGSGNTLNRG